MRKEAKLLLAVLTFFAAPAFAETVYGPPELKDFKLSAVVVTSDTQTIEEQTAYKSRYQKLFTSKDFHRAISKLAENSGNSNANLDKEGQVLGTMRIGPLGEVLDLTVDTGPKNWGFRTNSQAVLDACRTPISSIEKHEHDDVCNKQTHTLIASVPGSIVGSAVGHGILGTIATMIASTGTMVIHESIPEKAANRDSRGRRIADMDPADMTGYLPEQTINARTKIACQYAMDGSGVCTLRFSLGGAFETRSKAGDWRETYSGASRGIH